MGSYVADCGNIEGRCSVVGCCARCEGSCVGLVECVGIGIVGLCIMKACDGRL
jgi:hypothetical protein